MMTDSEKDGPFCSMDDADLPSLEDCEYFLEREALEISREEFIAQDFSCIAIPLLLCLGIDDLVSLCLVENRGFSACVVAENKEDAKRYADSTTDKRPKRYFVMERSKLESVTESK